MSGEIETVPENQERIVEKPILIPQYQHVKLSPINYTEALRITDNNPTNSLEFEIPGDNVINLANSYLEYKIQMETGFAQNDFTMNIPPAQLDNQGVMRQCSWSLETLTTELYSTFGISYIRVYNANGVNLFEAHDPYNGYIDFCRLLNRKHTEENDMHNRNHAYFDGVWSHQTDAGETMVGKKTIRVASNTMGYNMPPGAVFVPLININRAFTVESEFKVKLYFKELLNSILSIPQDIWFGEKIKIEIKFGQLGMFGRQELYVSLDNTHLFIQNPQAITNGTSSFNIKRMAVVHPKLYACYNQDPSCNENTINYILTHPLYINTFYCHQITVNERYGSADYNYQFNVNSANGSYLRFILYRCTYRNPSEAYPFNRAGAKFRWLINDYPNSFDFYDVYNYDNYEKLRPYIKNSYLDCFTDGTFLTHFFEILNFGNEKIFEQNVVAGKPLNDETKITFECTNPRWNNNPDLYLHLFYIISGRLLKIGRNGIESIM